jgi:DNA polymerase-1
LPERTAINAVIQGSAADLIKKAMIAIHHKLATGDLEARMLLQIHDELVFEVRQEHAETLGRLVVEEMSEAMTLSVPLKVDAGIGSNWLDLEPLAALGAAPA